MTRRGFTIIELIVAITLFVTIVTLAFGGFIAIAHLKTQMGDMKETQQKLRTISEMVSRDIKEADAVTVENYSEGDFLRIGYDQAGVRISEKIFVLGGTEPYGSFTLYDCTVGVNGYTADSTTFSNTGVCPSEDLLKSTTGTTFTLGKINDQDIFTTRGTIPKTVEVAFYLQNSEGTAFGSDKLDYDNLIMLEGAQ